MLIDSHCHINTLSAQEKSKIFLESTEKYCFIDSSIDLDSTIHSLSLSRQHPNVYSSVGFHPFNADKFSDKTIKKYARLIDESPKVVAIGEIGLDYKAEVDLDKQEEVLRKFIELAQKKDLPIAIHNRLEGPRILKILDEHYPSYEKVVFHCFSYSKEVLDKIVKKNGLISFSLNVLRKKKDLMASVESCPVENLILETDSPYMRVEDRLSTPLDIEKVYSFVAKVKKIKPESLEEKVYSNAKRFFSIS